MAARQIIVPGAMPSRDGNGRALPSKLYFYAPAAAFSTPKTVYKNEALTTPHPFPITSDSAGRFPQIWAEEAEYFDVGWARLDTGAPLPGFTNIRPLSDAVLASVTIAQQSADAAAADAAAAETSRMSAMGFASAASGSADAANDAADAAEAAQAAAELAAANAEAIAAGDLSQYQLRSEEGVANGYAPLNGANQVPATHLTAAPVSTAQQAAIDSAVAGVGTGFVALAVAFAIAL